MPRSVGERLEVLVDEPGVGRSHREAPDIDGVVHVDRALGVGEFHKVVVTRRGRARPVGRDVSEPLRERMRVSTFGPSALNTPANAITVARLLATPVLVVMIVVHGPGWAPFGVALAIGLTDGVDGWLARRQGTTRSGAFLDPLADKAAVVGALCAVAAKGEVSWLPVADHRARARCG